MLRSKVAEYMLHWALRFHDIFLTCSKNEIDPREINAAFINVNMTAKGLILAT